MKRYAYEAAGVDGETCSGQIEAESVSRAVLELEGRGLAIRSIQEIVAIVPHTEPAQIPETTSMGDEGESPLVQRINHALQQRTHLVQGLQALVDDLPRSSTSRSIQKFISRINRGEQTATLLNDPQTAQWLLILAHGLESSENRTSLREVIEEMFQESQNRQRRVAAWMYPAGLLFVAMCVLICLGLMVVPTFRKMFMEFGLRLPGPTILLIWIVDQFTVFWPRTLLIAAATLSFGLLLLWFLRNSPLPTKHFGRVSAGSSRQVSAMASMCRMLAELLALGASLPEALRIAGRNCSHPYFSMLAREMAEQVDAGHALPSQTIAARNLPPTLIYALGDGQRAPNVPLVRELATIYTERIRMRCDWSADLVGSIAVFGVGVIVFLIVIALFMPLISMISALS